MARTAKQIEANKIDLELDRLWRRAEREGMDEASLAISRCRPLVREHMHPADREATQ